MAGENMDPARAFDDLRAEVSVLRRAVEGLPEAWRENRPPDYSPDLGRMVNALGAVGRHLEAIERNPMLKIEPSSYRHAVEQAGMAASQRMQGAFDGAMREVRAERQQLAGIIGQARAQDRQNWWLLGVGATCLVVGLLVSPVVASVLPTALGTRIASFIVGKADRWESGMALMRNANPDAWNWFMWEDRLVQDNLPKIRECRIAATRDAVPKNCVIAVNPDHER